MNAIQFRRGLVLVGIKNGLDLGAAVAAAKEADAWCLAAGTADVDALTGGRAMADERLALAAPASPPPAAETRPSKSARAKPTRVKRAAPAAPSAGKREGPPARRAAVADRWAKIDRALKGAGADGLSSKALEAVVGCSNPTIVADLRAMLEAGHVVRWGPKSGAKVRWMHAALNGPIAKHETKPARAAAPTAAPPVPAAIAADREDVGGGGDLLPAPSIAAGPPRALPPRDAARPAVIVRNARVEEAVLRAIDRGAADFETIRTRAEFPANNVRLALEALAAEKTIRAKGGIWQRQGGEE